MTHIIFTLQKVMVLKSRFIFFLILILTFSPKLHAKLDFDYKLYNSNLYGILQNDNKVLLYGSNGVIMHSNNKCKVWTQVNFDPNYNFQFMTNDKEKVYTIVNYSMLGISKDWTKNFEFRKMEFDSTILDILIKNEELYILHPLKIEIVNINNFTKEQIILGDSADKFMKFDNYLYIFNKNEKIIKINFANKEINSLTYNNCKDCNQLISYSLDSNKVYFVKRKNVLNGTLFELNLENEKITEIYSSKTKDSVNPEILENIVVKNKQIFNFSLSILSFKSEPLTGYKVSHIDTNGLNDIYINKDEYINTYMTNLKFVNDSCMLLVGSNKGIFLSENNGKNWLVISNFIEPYDNRRFAFISDSIITYLGRYENLVRSSDAGTTWISMKKRKKEYEKPVYISALYLSNDTNERNIIMYSKFITEIYDSNKLIKTEIDSSLKSDWGNQFKFQKHLNTFWMGQTFGIKNTNRAVLYKLDSNYHVTKTINFDSTMLINIYEDKNKDLNLFLLSYKDTYRDIILQSKKLDLILLKSTDDGENWDTVFTSPNESIKNAGSISTNNFIKINDEQFIASVAYTYPVKTNDKVVFKAVNVLYQINPNSVKQIYIDSTDFTQLLTNTAYYNDTLLLNGPIEPIYLTNNFSKIDTLENSKVFYKSFFNHNNKLYAYLYNSNYGNGLAQIFPKNNNTSGINNSNNETAQTNNTYLYNYPPYPIPAKDIVNCSIHWDTRYDIKDAKLAVYNIFGEMIDNNPQNIYINASQAYEGTLTWDCKNQAAGVYLLSVKYGTIDKKIPILIGR